METTTSPEELLKVPAPSTPQQRRYIQEKNAGIFGTLVNAWRDRRVLMLVVLTLIASNVFIALGLVTLLYREQVVIVVDQEGNMVIGPAVDFAKANKLHTMHGLMATWCLLNRSPSGFEQKELQEALFYKDAGTKARRELEAAMPELKSKDIRQLADVKDVHVAAVKQEGKYQMYYIDVSGQVTRSGVFGGQAFREIQDFRILYKCVRNPRISANGRYPLVVLDYSYKTPVTGEEKIGR